jgi:inorganic pyrophosphatase
MAALNRLPARDSETGLINVVVDTPKRSRNKYKHDEKYDLWRLSKLLPLGASFPFGFGFIPSTKGEDGDPIDVLVLTEELCRLCVTGASNWCARGRTDRGR